MSTAVLEHTKPLVSVEEYLHSSYRPAVEDHVLGELQERSMGEYEHGAVQAALIVWFRARRHDWNIRAIPELRFQTRAGNQEATAYSTAV